MTCVTKESEKLIIKLLFTSRRPLARSHAGSANTRNASVCNTKAFLKNKRREPPAVWSASNGASENLNGSCESTVSIPLSLVDTSTSDSAQGLHQSIFVCYAIVLQSCAPCFLAELLGAKSTSHCDHQGPPVSTVLQLFWLSIGSHFCSIKGASETISERLKFQNFLGELSMPPGPLAGALCPRGSQINLEWLRGA